MSVQPNRRNQNENSTVCARFDESATPDANDRATTGATTVSSLEQGWPWQDEHVFRDAGYSGASVNRPGLDRLRDQVARAAFDLVLMTAPDRLARKYVHQMLLLEELERAGCRVEFVDRPMSQDPHDQLLLQIRGAVARVRANLDC